MEMVVLLPQGKRGPGSVSSHFNLIRPHINVAIYCFRSLSSNASRGIGLFSRGSFPAVLCNLMDCLDDKLGLILHDPMAALVGQDVATVSETVCHGDVFR